MFDKLSQKHLQVGAKSWRPLAAGDPQKRGGITANLGVFVSNVHHQPPQPKTPAPPQTPAPPLSEHSFHPEPLVDHEFEPPPEAAVHFASPHDSVPASSRHSQHGGGAAHSVASGITGREMGNHDNATIDQPSQPSNVEMMPSNAELDAAVTEGILMRTRQDIEEQERALAELQKAQELLALRESEIRIKEEAFQQMLDAERIRIEEDARIAQEAADRAASEALLKAEAEQQAKSEEIERERQAHQREIEERQREIHERQREMQDRQREIEEKEQAMILQLEEEKQRLADEAKAALEENIREQRRLEEEARLEEELARIRAEEQARAELAEKIAAEEEAKVMAKRAARARLEQREDALRAFHVSHIYHEPPVSQPVLREFNPISYAQAYSSPSVYAYSLPPSPILPLSPLFVPDEVKQAAQAQRQKYESEKKRREEEQRVEEERLKTLQLEAQLKAATEQLAAEQEQAHRAQLEHKAKIEELERRTRAVEARRFEALQEADFKKERERLDEENALTIRKEWEAKRREDEEEMIRKERAEVAKLQAEQAAAKQHPSSPSAAGGSSSDDGMTDAKKRGAQAASYFMAKQALSKPLRSRRVSTSHHTVGRQRRASYTESPMLSSSSPGSGFMVFSFDEIPGYSHDAIGEVESSYIMDVSQTPALEFLHKTDEGRRLASQGQWSAVEALVKLAEELNADAIIKLTSQRPVLINENQVNFSATGLAVSVKFPSPDRLKHRTPSFVPKGSSLYNHPTASAPVRALQTPALSLKSEPFDVGSPKNFHQSLPRIRFDLDSLIEQSSEKRKQRPERRQTPAFELNVVPPSNSSKCSTPNVEDKRPSPLNSPSPSEQAREALPHPPNFTSPINPASSTSPAMPQVPCETCSSSAHQGVGTVHDSAVNSPRHSTSTNVHHPAEPPSRKAIPPTIESAAVKSAAPVAPAPSVTRAPSTTEHSRPHQFSARQATPATSKAYPPLPSEASSRSSTPSCSSAETPPHDRREREDLHGTESYRMADRSTSRHRNRSSSVATRASEPGSRSVSSPSSPKQTFASSEKEPSRSQNHSRASSKSYKRYSATQVPLPMTPEERRRSYESSAGAGGGRRKGDDDRLKTPRMVPLPDSPRESPNRGQARRSVHFPDVWIGDQWDSHSPAMASLRNPMTPRVGKSLYERQEPAKSEHSSPLMDLDGEFDILGRRWGRTKAAVSPERPVSQSRARYTSWWEDLNQLA
ncbi:uncharacterized protein MELLADRAFT_94374 [Melampsora larici-populina 98AG31]|uniref:Uncharacterized protein n=1 Tax=Melampsora larici-populina (strain 98AG31 / pathotype 3-4-7) TaxID=747676 RepID=F4RB97_MELLP|nr:uncharacterized protein MELLADRAFT_94374 [Melampsora larici-populina 98AG31]EGG10396.1 hypothetical protein MELLADRAFT_94374 [Melampsora larici-populina 98AG31]